MEKCKVSRKLFIFCTRCEETEILYRGYNRSSSRGRALEARKMFQRFYRKALFKIAGFKHFSKMLRSLLRKFVQKQENNKIFYCKWGLGVSPHRCDFNLYFEKFSPTPFPQKFNLQGNFNATSERNTNFARNP